MKQQSGREFANHRGADEERQIKQFKICRPKPGGFFSRTTRSNNPAPSPPAGSLTDRERQRLPETQEFRGLGAKSAALINSGNHH